MIGKMAEIDINTDFSLLFSRIDELLSKDDGLIIIAVDGGSASGKTTLAGVLSEKYDCNVFHTDDFFLRPEQRTPERFAEIGGNLDRERFQDEVLTPLKNNQAVVYRRFNCATFTLDKPISVASRRVNVVEGAYSMHLSFGNYHHLSVFLNIASDYQRERILKRNSAELAERFFNEWIPLELKYFSGTKILSRADIVIDICKNK